MFNFFNLSLRLNGFPIKEASVELEKILAVSENEYSNYINQKKKEIVATKQWQIIKPICGSSLRKGGLR
jgi:hypothetical protein